MKLYWDMDAQRLVMGLRDDREPIAVMMYARELAPIKLTLCERSSDGDAFTSTQLATGETLMFKAKVDPTNANTLFAEDTWTWNEDDDVYEADVDLLTAQLISAITGKKQRYIRGELVIRDANSRDTTVTQFDILLINNVDSDSEVPDVVTNNAKFISGVLHIYDPEQDKWFPVTGVGVAGEEQLTYGGTGQ